MSATGILIPIINQYEPGLIYACDLSDVMLEQLRSKEFPNVRTIFADVRDLMLPGSSIDVVFINACYGNIADKAGAFSNIGRMMRAGERMVISHPLGKRFIPSGRAWVKFPLDDFPGRPEAERLLRPFGFEIETFVDEPELYILIVSKSEFKTAVDSRIDGA
jgi:SAM-dependent methyltransferase